jgi:two-component system, chemotaxis family, protein-glutamate methylesterase/glutaminase
MRRPRRIVLCESSESRQRSLRSFLGQDPDIEVAGVFAGLEAMVAGLADLAPDLVALDLETVGSDVAAAVRLTTEEGGAPVVLLGGGGRGDEKRVATGLAAGALEAIPDARLRFDQPDDVWATALRSRLKRLASIRLDRGDDRAALDGGLDRRAWRSPTRCYRAVGIGASVGGPSALVDLLGELPGDYPLPMLIVQHMAPGFGIGLADWLNRNVAAPVALAEDGGMLRPGIWIAPDGVHLRLGPTMRLSLDATTVNGAHRPSLDVLFKSLATSLGAEAVGVVLTGMGRDGAEGVRAIGAVGGLTMAQDEASSAVFGMPKAAIDVGVDEVLDLTALAGKLTSLRPRRFAE